MSLTFDQAAIYALVLHVAGETKFAAKGFTPGTLGLVAADGTITVAPDGPDGPSGLPPDRRFLLARIRSTGARALTVTEQCWVDASAIPPRADPPPADCPGQSPEPDQNADPASAPHQDSYRDGRAEVIVTTLVFHGESVTLRIITPILRDGPDAARLAPRSQIWDDASAQSGRARRLDEILTAAITD